MFKPSYHEPDKKPKMYQVATNISYDLLEFLQNMARDNNTTVSGLLREMIYYCISDMEVKDEDQLGLNL